VLKKNWVHMYDGALHHVEALKITVQSRDQVIHSKISEQDGSKSNDGETALFSPASPS